MRSLILLLALFVRAAHAQTDAPIDVPDGLDLEACFSAMVKADVDESGAIDKVEYLTFINTFGEQFCWYQEQLTFQQHGAFNELACICRSQGGSDASCCLLDNAKLPTTNTLNPQAHTEEQLRFMSLVCVVTYATIENLCIPEEDHASPLSDILPFCDFPHDIFGDNLGSIWDRVLDCLNNYPTCVDLATQGNELLQCFGNPSIDNGECFADILECVQNIEPIFDPFYTLPSCVIESSLELTQCFLENVGTCAAACVSTDWTLPFEALDLSTLTACAGITDDIIDPLCQTLSCCEPCVEAWERLSSCLLSDVLQWPCESRCSAQGNEPPQRQLESHVVADTAISTQKPMTRDLQKHYRCNICGCDDCTFANDNGVVEFVNFNKAEKRTCKQLQQEAQNPTIINTTYCQDVIWKAAFEPCFCFNTNFPDTLLSEIPGYEEREYGNSGTLEDDGEEEEHDGVEEGENGAGDGAHGDDLELQEAMQIFSDCLDNFEGGVDGWINFANCVFQSVLSIYMDTDSVVKDETSNSTTTETPTVPPTLSPPSNETDTVTSPTVLPTESPTNSSLVTKTQSPTYSPSTSPINTTTEFPTSSPTYSTVPSNLTETLSPSYSPTTFPTKTPQTSPPTGAPLGGSTSTQTFEFSDLSMRLQGGKPLTAESRAAFEIAAEEFYQKAFQTTNTGGARRLKDVSFSSFQTDVKVTGESVDTTGNTITYDQSVTFVSTTGLVDEESTREVILEPLDDKEQQEEFIQLLQENDSDFESVTDAETQSRSDRSTESDESDNGFLIIIIAAAAALVLCCCAACIYNQCFPRKEQQNRSNMKSRDMNEPDNDYMVPEGPLPKSVGETFVDDAYTFDDFRKKDVKQNADGLSKDSGGASEGGSGHSGSGNDYSGSDEDDDSGSEASEERSGGSFI